MKKKKRLGWLLLLWWKRTREMRIYGRTTWSSLVWSPIYVCHHVFSFGIQSLMHHWFLGICPIKSIQKDWHLSMEVLGTSWKLELLEVLLRIFFSTLATSTDVAPPWPPPVSPKKYQSESTTHTWIWNEVFLSRIDIICQFDACYIFCQHATMFWNIDRYFGLPIFSFCFVRGP